MPLVKKIHRTLGSRGLQVVAIAKNRPRRVAQFRAYAGIPYVLGADRRGRSARAYQIYVIPAFVLIDKRGIVRDLAVGRGWGAALPRLLKKAAQLLSTP